MRQPPVLALDKLLVPTAAVGWELVTVGSAGRGVLMVGVVITVRFVGAPWKNFPSIGSELCPCAGDRLPAATATAAIKTKFNNLFTALA